MYKTYCILLLFFSSVLVSAQNVVDVDIKAGFTKPFSIRLFEPATTRSSISLTVGADIYKNLGRRIFLGVFVQYQHFDFYQYLDHEKYNKEQIWHLSNYLSLAPSLNVKLERKQYFQAYLAAPIGILLGGQQRNERYSSWRYPTWTVEGYLNKVYIGLGFGLRQAIPLAGGKWSVLLDESYNIFLRGIGEVYAPGYVHPNFINFQAGIMRTYVYERRHAKRKKRTEYQFQNIQMPVSPPRE